MKNTLTDLNNYLFEALERLQDGELDDEALDREIKRQEATCKVADAIIRNGELALKTMKHLDAYGVDPEEETLAPMLTARTK